MKGEDVMSNAKSMGGEHVENAGTTDNRFGYSVGSPHCLTRNIP